MERTSETVDPGKYRASEIRHFLACYIAEMSGKLVELASAKQRSSVGRSLETVHPLVGSIDRYSDL